MKLSAVYLRSLPYFPKPFPLLNVFHRLQAFLCWYSENMFLWTLLHLVTIFSLLDVSKAAPNTTSSSTNSDPTSIPAPLVVPPSQEWYGS